jgi:hypothetical protein
MIVTGQSKCTIALSQRFLANSMGSAPFYKYKLVFLMIKADKQKNCTYACAITSYKETIAYPVL